MRYAFEYARRHRRKKVTSATKSNAINYSMVFWDDVFREVSARYPDVQGEQQLIDSLCACFVTAPESLDVVVASNLFGDIVTDLGAAIAGSMGLAPSANLNPEGNYPSLFQAIHGSAPGLAGKGIADPVATIWSVAMMLDHLDETELGKVVLGAVESVIAAGKVRTSDLGGSATTRQMGQAIIATLRKPEPRSGETSSKRTSGPELRLVCPFELTRWRGGRCAWRALVRGCASSELAPGLGKPL